MNLKGIFTKERQLEGIAIAKLKENTEAENRASTMKQKEQIKSRI